MSLFNQPLQTTETYVWARAVTYYYVDFADGKPVGISDAVQKLPISIKTETTKNVTVPAQALSLAGYTFKGYKVDNKTVNPGDTIDKQAADAHVVLMAVWEKIAPIPSSTTTPVTTPIASQPDQDPARTDPHTDNVNQNNASAGKELPQTGDTLSVAALTGISGIAILALLSGRKVRAHMQR